MTDNNTYTGWCRWEPTSDEWLTLYTENKVPFVLKENEYLIVKTADKSTTFYCNEKGKLRKFTGSAIKTYKDTTPVLLEENKNKQEEKHCISIRKFTHLSKESPQILWRLFGVNKAKEK